MGVYSQVTGYLDRADGYRSSLRSRLLVCAAEVVLASPLV
jgi:hypothetical protein